MSDEREPLVPPASGTFGPVRLPDLRLQLTLQPIVGDGHSRGEVSPPDLHQQGQLRQGLDSPEGQRPVPDSMRMTNVSVIGAAPAWA
jgi:hypothetical protein